MDKNYEEKYHKLEDNNWWFKSRRDMILKLMPQENKQIKILEVGCSGGPLLNILHKRGFKNLYGIDISKDAISNCKKKGIKNVCVADACKMRFKKNEFDVIIASDVLEHIKYEQRALLEWRRILRPNGCIIIFVPAFKFLWSDHDKVNHHFRRYSKKTMEKALKKAGFSIKRMSYWNFVMFFPLLFTRFFQSIFNLRKNKEYGDSLHETNFLVNNFLTALLKIENFMLKYTNYPAGISLFAIVRK